MIFTFGTYDYVQSKFSLRVFIHCYQSAELPVSIPHRSHSDLTHLSSFWKGEKRQQGIRGIFVQLTEGDLQAAPLMSSVNMNP